MTTVAMTIAGSDPSGGAGLQADLKTFQQHRVYGTSVVTLLTVQNTRQVSDVRTMPPELVAAQLEAVLDDVAPRAAKTGALGSAAVIRAVAERAAQFAFPLVVDPVMVSKHGDPLLDEDAVAVLVEALLPRAFLVTPNLAEARALAGFEVTDRASMERAAETIARMGAEHVLVKGGRQVDKATDVLFSGGRVQHFPGEAIDTPHTHGSGCVYSAAITARLARGEPLEKAIAWAKSFVTRAIRTGCNVGRGIRPVNTLVPPEDDLAARRRGG